MKKVQTFSGQRWKKEIVDHLQDTKEEAIKERFTDYIKPGILPSTAIQFKLTPGSANSVLNPRLTILPGVGFSSLGERIEVSADFDDIQNPNDYLSTNPEYTTDNGLGVFINTPRSTGTQNIPLDLGSINKIWIGYIAVVDDSQFTFRKNSVEKQFYKQLDGYQIKISLTNPDVNTYIYLGQVDLTTDLLVTTGNVSLVDRQNATFSNLSVDQGSGSLLDADKLDGFDSSYFQNRAEKDQPSGYAGLDQNRFITITEIPQGTGSNLDADKVDGHHALPATDAGLGTAAAADFLVALDSTGMFPTSVIPPVPVPPAPFSPAPFRFLIQGTPETATKVSQALSEFAATINTFMVYVDALPTGSATLTVTATKNGSAFSAISFNSSDPQLKQNTGLSIAVAAGDRIGLNISVAGSGTYGGEDIVVTLRQI